MNNVKCWSLILVCLLATFALAQNTQKVTASGIGMDRNAALDDARRNAIEQGLGVALSSHSVAANFQLLSDNIYSRADGFVTSYNLLKDERLDTGQWQVTIEASVTKMLDQVLADQAAVDILLEMVGRPRLMFLIDEQISFDWYRRDSGLVETVLMQTFFEKNFNIVDREQIAQIRNKDLARQAATGDAEAVQNLGRMFKAECIIVGNASAARNSGGYGMASVRADINVKAIRVDTGELLGVVHESATKAQTTEEAATRDAFEQVSKKVANVVISHIIRKWGGESANTTPVFIQITSIDFLQAANFETWLKDNVTGVKRVNSRPFEGNVAELEVAYEGTANDLAKAIAVNKTYPMKVVSLTQNKIVLARQ
ncbi:MAG: hypothetical protein NTW14_12585 [bacterium]|nr:hypothetical protein [bacterium]